MAFLILTQFKQIKFCFYIYPRFDYSSNTKPSIYEHDQKWPRFGTIYKVNAIHKTERTQTLLTNSIFVKNNVNLNK